MTASTMQIPAFTVVTVDETGQYQTEFMTSGDTTVAEICDESARRMGLPVEVGGAQALFHLWDEEHGTYLLDTQSVAEVLEGREPVLHARMAGDMKVAVSA